MRVFHIFKKLANIFCSRNSSLKIGLSKFFIFHCVIFIYVAEISDGRHQQPVYGSVGPEGPKTCFKSHQLDHNRNNSKRIGFFADER